MHLMMNEEIRRNLEQMRAESMRRSMPATTRRARRPRPVRARLGRGLIALGERFEPLPRYHH